MPDTQQSRVRFAGSHRGEKNSSGRWAEDRRACGDGGGMTAEKPEKVWDGRGTALDDARMTHAAGRLADDLRCRETHLRIMAHVGRQNAARGWLRVSQSELAERWSVHRMTVNKAINQLVEWGYLAKRDQQEAGESFCLYKIVLDDEAVLPPEARTRAASLPDDNGGGVQSYDCTPTGDAGEGGSDAVGLHMCSPSDCTPAVLATAPPPDGVNTTRARRHSPTLAEVKSPFTPASGGTGGGKPGDEAGIISDKQRGWLETLAAEPHDHNVLARLIAPLLRERRFSAEAPLEELRALMALARGLPGPALDKAWDLLRDAKHQGRPLTTIKAARVRDAIGAVRQGGAMVMIRRGTPQWQRWREHFERTDPPMARFMSRMGELMVRAEWPPGAGEHPETPATDNPGAAA